MSGYPDSLPGDLSCFHTEKTTNAFVDGFVVPIKAHLLCVPRIRVPS